MTTSPVVPAPSFAYAFDSLVYDGAPTVGDVVALVVGEESVVLLALTVAPLSGCGRRQGAFVASWTGYGPQLMVTVR